MLLSAQVVGQGGWERLFKGTGRMTGLGIGADLFGNIYGCGSFYGSADFNQSIAQGYNLTSNGRNDVFVVKLNSYGGFVWAKSFGGNRTDGAYDMEVDVFGNLTVVGSFFDSVDFNSGIGVQRIVAQSTLRDGFVCRLDANGDLIWVNQLGGIGSDEVKAVSVDNTGNVVVAGTFEGTVDFDPGVGVANLTSSGMQDVFIVKYHTSGSFLWAKQVGGAWADIANSLSIDIENSIYCAGEFEGVADFD